MRSIVSKFESAPEAFADNVLNYVGILPLVAIISFGALLAWQYSIVIGLENKVAKDLKIKVKRFKVFFFIPLFYFAGFFILFMTTMNGMNNGQIESSLNTLTYAFIFIVPLHLFSIFCLIHTIFFVAKTIKTVEMGREVKFNDFAGDFFLVWILPIGIWFLQPKINEMIEGNYKQEFV